MLDALDVTNVNALLELLQDQARQHRKRRLIFRLLDKGVVCLVLIFTFLLIALRNPLGVNWLSDSAMQVLSVLPLLWLIVLAPMDSVRGAKPLLKQVVERVCEAGTVQTVGPLLDALALKEYAVRDMAITTLAALLPRLTASDRSLLSDAQREVLHRCLSEKPRDRDTRFHMAILGALEQVGDSRAIRAVRQWAQANGSTREERDLIEAAGECLRSLELLAEDERQRETLLHPVDTPATQDLLLRPASHAPEAGSPALLRLPYEG